MRRFFWLTGCGLLAMLLLACQASAPAADSEQPLVTVYKSPTCGCCTKWAAHLEANGFRVQVKDVTDLAAVKAQYGVPERLTACHTAVVEGYVVEGHVPATDIVRLLSERPAVRGIAVPGMPLGSPGMESSTTQPYTTYTFDEVGNITVFAEH